MLRSSTQIAAPPTLAHWILAVWVPGVTGSEMKVKPLLESSVPSCAEKGEAASPGPDCTTPSIVRRSSALSCAAAHPIHSPENVTSTERLVVPPKVNVTAMLGMSTYAVDVVLGLSVAS